MNARLKGGVIFGAISALSMLSGYFAQPARSAPDQLKIVAPLMQQQTIDERVFQVGRTRIMASPQVVWDILVDYDSAQKMLPNVKKCFLVKENADCKQIGFSVKTMCNLVTLHYILDVKEKFPRIEWTRSSGAFKRNDGFWHLDSAEDGKACDVTYAKFIDGGLIPQAMIDGELKRNMPIILTNLKSLAEERARAKVSAHLSEKSAKNRI